ncbi:MAG TPA: hypothetical protein PK156_41695, partial [Polyangium sp.]|nr:hypothetical protein [Polyangium sp.]
MSAIESASGLLEAARRAESAAWVIVLARDSDADDAIGAVRDEMWNAVGRVRDNEPMGVVFPGGIGTYTAGDPGNQPILMQVLHSRILAGSAPQWTESERHGWAATIEAIRIPYVSAVETYRPTEAAL